MRITAIAERTFQIDSEMRNAVIDFRHMTVSAVAISTDVVRDGKPVVGYGFSSNGRYGQGCLLRDRFIPRLLAAAPDSLLDETGINLDPTRAWATMMHNEKPGGHGERSVAVGVLDMAIWDLVGKIEEKPLFAILAERYGTQLQRRVFVYAAGGYYRDGASLDLLKDEMHSYVERGFTVVKMKIGGVPLNDDLRRIEAVLGVLPSGHGLAHGCVASIYSESCSHLIQRREPHLCEISEGKVGNHNQISAMSIQRNSVTEPRYSAPTIARVANSTTKSSMGWR
jgi:L-alanine-DL-glutamate epimerase-like enolase superfamily enzyme